MEILNSFDISGISIDALEQESIKRQCERSLLEYIKYKFKSQGKFFKVNSHHVEVCHMMEDIYFGREKNLLANIAPRYTKTEIIIKSFPEWAFLKTYSLTGKFDLKFLHLTYSESLAMDNSSEIRDNMKSEFYQMFWPVRFRTDSDSKKKWKTADGGEFSATGTAGAVIGFGAGRIDHLEGDFPLDILSLFENGHVFGGAILIDDPMKAEEAESETIRTKINKRLTNTIASRRNSPRNTPTIIVMQRLHEEDVSGYVLDGGYGEDFHHLCRPVITSDNKPLWPDKHDMDQLNSMKKADPYVFAGQYMQAPAPADGIIFKRFEFYKEIPRNISITIHSWDFTFKKSMSSDYVVGTRWGMDATGRMYLLDMVRAKMGFTESLDAIVRFTEKHPDYSAILIEAKANGEAIIDSIRGTVRKVIPVIPNASKEERAAVVSHLFDAGEVYLPDPSFMPWSLDVVKELKTFPNAKHDDIVDSCTQALEHLDKIGSISNIGDANKKSEPFRKTFNNKKRSSGIKVKAY